MIDSDIDYNDRVQSYDLFMHQKIKIQIKESLKQEIIGSENKYDGKWK